MDVCSRRIVITLSALSALVFSPLASPAWAGFQIGPDAANYAVLYEGTGGHNLQITNVTINGNIGVGGTGAVHFGGPGAINGRLDFSAPNTGQFSNSNGSNVGPTSVNYNVAAVTTALSTVNGLSTTLGAESGTPIAITPTSTINAIDGVLDGNGNRVFDVTSLSTSNGSTVTINGDLAGDSVVFNIAKSAVNNPQFQGNIVLSGLTPDQVLFNVTGSGSNLSINTNASSFPTQAARGIFLDPLGTMSATNANIVGRFFGGDSNDMQIVSGTTLTQPSTVPEPSSLALMVLGLGGLTGLAHVQRQRRRRSV